MVQLGALRSAVEWFRRLSWRSLRIPALFLVSVALLTLMYRLRSDRIDKEEAEKALKISSVLLTASITVPKTERTPTGGRMTLWPDEADLSELASHERWVVVSGVEDEEGRGGVLAAEVACSLAAAVKAHGWRPIVIGEGLNCCRLPDCVPLDGALLSRLPYRILRFIESAPPPLQFPSSAAPPVAASPPHPSALRNAAFLFAIQHGARFVFDAYPPSADPRTLTSWANEIFSSMVLGTSVGLVLDGHSYSFPTSVPGAPTPRVLNPYAHFGRPDLWAKGYDLQDADEQQQQHLRYRVCEIKQPSVEMFLDVWDGGPADLIAPPVTVPSSILAPYGSRNVLYTRDAFWGLALFPGTAKNSSSSPKLSPNLARALWNHALLGATLDAGGVRFSLVPGTQGINSNKSNSIISWLSMEEDDTNPDDLRAYVSTFTSRVLRWRCRSTTLLPCVSQLASDFLATSLLTPEDAAFMEAWVTDLRRVRYLPPPTLPWSPRPPPRPPGPCIHPPHHHHRQLHDPPLPHPTALTFRPIHLQTSMTTLPSSIRMLIARFHRDAALLEWSVGNERTKEEVALVEETLTEDRLLSDAPSKSEGTIESKDKEDNLSRKTEESATKEEEEELLEDVTDHPLSQEAASTRTFLGDVADHLCPGFAPLASPLLSHKPSSLNLEDVLLVVWFPRPPRYDLLPALELLRSRHFPNALFCGPPHRALPSMLSRFDGHTSPSFLTATSRSDCLLTALEMGYRVGEEGSLLLVEESALPIPWTLSERNRSLIWFHTEKEEVVRDKRSTRETEGKGSAEGYEGDFGQGGRRTSFRVPEESVIVAAEGLASALRFMARLMGVRPNPHLHPHHHPMDDIEHEESPWSRMPENMSQPNITDDSLLINMTLQETPELGNSTLSETLVVVEEKTNNTDEVAAIVEEIVIKEVDETESPVVEHVDTPSVEYSEPVVVEYSEPLVLDNHKIAEDEKIEPAKVENDDAPSTDRSDTHVEENAKFSGDKQSDILAEKHIDTPVEKHIDVPTEKEVDDPDEKYLGISLKELIDTLTEEKIEIQSESEVDNPSTDNPGKDFVENLGKDDLDNSGRHVNIPDKYHGDMLEKDYIGATDKDHADKLDQDHVEAPEKHVEIPDKDHVETPDKDYVEIPDKDHGDTLDKYHVDTLDKDHVDTLDKYHVDTLDKDHVDSSDKSHADILDKDHIHTPVIEHVDTPAIEYSEPAEVEHFGNLEIGTFRVNDTQILDQENVGITEKSAVEVKLDAAEIVTVMSDTSLLKHEENITTEWPPIINATAIPWNDNDTKFDLPLNNSSSDWVTSAEAEEILSSITMIENAPENNTEELSSHDEVVTEYFVKEKVNLTYPFDPLEETKNSSLQQTFEIKSSELYEDEKDEIESVGDSEQSLLEQDTLLSYKDIEDTPQFVGLPSSTAKSHFKSIEASLSESDPIEGERRKRDTSYSDGRANYSMDGFKEQFMRTRESQEDGTEGLAISVRLSRSLQEIEELFKELASGFPEDSDAVLREEGNPEVLSYPTPHYGLDHTDFRHLHCDYRDMESGEEDGDWGESDSLNFEPCTILRRFFLRLYYSHQSEGSLLHLLSLATTKGSAPIFHLPMRLQRELHLTASLLLSQGFPEEAVLPLLVYGLAGEKGWVNLKRSSFGDSDVAFPVFDDSCDFIHPTNLRIFPEEPRLRSVFCLKFLLRVLDG